MKISKTVIKGTQVEHKDFMKRAIALAKLGGEGGHGGPFGCVVVKEGKIVGEGFNQVLSATDPTAHGEMVALRSAAKYLGTHDLSDCTVYNISVPCPMCLAAMYWARVKSVYYCCKPEDARAIGFDNAEIALQLSKPLPAQSLPVIEMPTLYPEARAVYDQWSQNRSSRRY
jgi:guanine deaminase